MKNHFSLPLAALLMAALLCGCTVTDDTGTAATPGSTPNTDPRTPNDSIIDSMDDAARDMGDAARDMGDALTGDRNHDSARSSAAKR